jgi:phage terminase large subunit-like protein
MGRLTAQVVASWSIEQREIFLSGLSVGEQESLKYKWDFWARDSQLEPPNLPSGLPWRYWLVLAGRGFGKSRMGAEQVRKWVTKYPRVNIAGATTDDARDIMIEGESGIMAICPASERPRHKKQAKKLIWPSGAVSLVLSADEPERFRGKQHMKCWADEVGSWRYEEAWTQLALGLRIGNCPQCIITTTPRNRGIIKDLIKHPFTYKTVGTTYENRWNLDKSFFSDILRQYEGTRMGRQELLAQVLDDNPGALWNRSLLDATRVVRHPQLGRVVVGVDPAISNNEESCATGIVVAGTTPGDQKTVHGYVLSDESVYGTPKQWATSAVTAFHKFKADHIIAEANQGGMMVEHVIKSVDQNVPVRLVHASRGKRTRAEPISTIYETRRVHHVGEFAKLEDEMCSWVVGEPGPSPDRMDALVWAFYDLFIESQSSVVRIWR